MFIYPAIDLFDGKAVRLTRGEYDKIKIYSDTPYKKAREFFEDGARYLHVVDLQGARDGGTPNFDSVKNIINSCGLSVEIGGGIRSLDTIGKYLSIGVKRVILGTSAVGDDVFLENAVSAFGEAIVCGADIKNGFVALRGWTELSSLDVYSFFDRMTRFGVKSVICTDVSKDGAMSGTNMSLYTELSNKYPDIKITASGGINSYGEIKELASLGIYGAILGKSIYEGTLNVKDAIKASENGGR